LNKPNLAILEPAEGAQGVKTEKPSGAI